MASIHRSSGRWQLGLALALVTMCLWGVLPIALSVALQALDVYTLTWTRFFIAFVLLGLILFARGKLPPLAKLGTGGWGLLAVATVFLAANYLLYLEGLQQTTPANAQVLIQLAPVMFGLGALAIFKERYTALQWLGLGGLTVGLGLFFNEQLHSLLTSTAAYLVGSSLIVVAAATWAIYALAQKQLLVKLSSEGTMFAIYGGCAVLFMPFAHPGLLLATDGLHAAVILFCALNTLVAYGAFAEALDHWEASRVSAVLACTPLVTLASVWLTDLWWPALLAARPLSWLGLAGALLVVVGSMAMALGKQPARTSS